MGVSHVIENKISITGVAGESLHVQYAEGSPYVEVFVLCARITDEKQIVRARVALADLQKAVFSLHGPPADDGDPVTDGRYRNDR